MKPVLPPLPDSGLRSIDDLLSTEEREELRAALEAMAEIRRRAEATAAYLYLS